MFRVKLIPDRLYARGKALFVLLIGKRLPWFLGHGVFRHLQSDNRKFIKAFGELLAKAQRFIYADESRKIRGFLSQAHCLKRVAGFICFFGLVQ